MSRRSAEEVREMIRLVRPDTVLVELCAGRAARLRAGQPASELDFFKVQIGAGRCGCGVV